MATETTDRDPIAQVRDAFNVDRETLALYDAARRDPRIFATGFCQTAKKSDAARLGSIQPTAFPDYDYLTPWWLAFAARENVVWLKTRQMVASWTVMVSFLWAISFLRDWAAIVVSRSGHYVDDGGDHSSYQSLLGKARYAWLTLPPALRAPLIFSPYMVRNEALGSVIVGEKATPDAGRSGSFDAGLMDEAARTPWGEEVYSALEEACPRGLVKLSTPRGDANVFARLFRQASQPETDEQIIRTPWWEHPGRRCGCTEPLSTDTALHHGCWYAKRAEKLSPAQIASELNMQFSTSTSGRVFPSFDSAIHANGSVRRTEGLPIYRIWDFGVGGETAILIANFVQIHTLAGNILPAIRMFDSYANSGKPAKHYREVLAAKAESYGRDRVCDYGDPHSLNARDSKLSSWRKNLCDEEHPYKINVLPTNCVGVPKRTVLDNAERFFSVVECAGREDGDPVQHVARFLIDTRELSHVEMLLNWAYPIDDEGRIVSDLPNHDHYSHRGDAHSYMAWVASPMFGGATRPMRQSDFAIVAPSALTSERGERSSSVFAEFARPGAEDEEWD